MYCKLVYNIVKNIIYICFRKNNVEDFGENK